MNTNVKQANSKDINNKSSEKEYKIYKNIEKKDEKTLYYLQFLQKLSTKIMLLPW